MSLGVIYGGMTFPAGSPICLATTNSPIPCESWNRNTEQMEPSRASATGWLLQLMKDMSARGYDRRFARECGHCQGPILGCFEEGAIRGGKDDEGVRDEADRRSRHHGEGGPRAWPE